MNAEHDTVGAQHRRWLEQVLKETGLAPSALAISVKLAPSTFTRLLKGRARTLHAETIAKVMQRHGVAPPPGYIVPQPVAPAGADDVTQVAPENLPDPLIAAALGAMQKTQDLSVWEVRSAAMDRENYLPGDFLVLDAHARPTAGQIVIANDRGSSASLLRILEPPYLIASSSNPAFRRPVLVDDNLVVVRGVVGPMLRPPRR
jgi:hypothetical protein